ncbi:MAG: hypothetical protein RL661_1258 [Pseudomonadota bacterium]|jgi:hypothetical protein
MSKSSEGKTPKASRASATKPAKKSVPSLSDAAINSVKAPASAAKGKTKVTSTTEKPPKAQSTPAKSNPSRKKATPAHVPPSQDMIDKMIEEAAYFLAEKRHFAPGFEEQDWLKAKQQIMAQIEGANRPLK